MISILPKPTAQTIVQESSKMSEKSRKFKYTEKFKIPKVQNLPVQNPVSSKVKKVKNLLAKKKGF